MYRLIIIGFIFLFFIGCAPSSIQNSSQVKLASISKLTNTIELIDRYYVDDIKYHNIIDKTFRGLVKNLDENSLYINDTKAAYLLKVLINNSNLENSSNIVSLPKDLKSIEIKDVFESNRLKNDIQYIKVPLLNKDIISDVKITLLANRNLSAVILDLRNNPGGYIQEAIDIIDLFVDDKLIVSKESKNKKEDFYTKKENTIYKGELIVLVNEASSSATEIIIASLQDNKRAKILGQKTLGNDSLSTIIPLSKYNSRFILLNAGKFTLPSRANLKDGISPDILVNKKEQQLKEALKLLNK